MACPIGDERAFFAVFEHLYRGDRQRWAVCFEVVVERNVEARLGEEILRQQVWPSTSKLSAISQCGSTQCATWPFFSLSTTNNNDRIVGTP